MRRRIHARGLRAVVHVSLSGGQTEVKGFFSFFGRREEEDT